VQAAGSRSPFRSLRTENVETDEKKKKKKKGKFQKDAGAPRRRSDGRVKRSF
jgi:hypothetical protein